MGWACFWCTDISIYFDSLFTFKDMIFPLLLRTNKLKVPWGKGECFVYDYNPRNKQTLSYIIGTEEDIRVCIHTYIYIYIYIYIYTYTYIACTYGLPWWLRQERICLQCGRSGFNSCVRNIPWRKGPIGNLLQYSYLENSMDRRGWQAIVHEVTKSQTWLSD